MIREEHKFEYIDTSSTRRHVEIILRAADDGIKHDSGNFHNK